MSAAKQELEKLALVIIERMKTNAKEMGSTNWEMMGDFQGATKKQTVIALAYLKDVKAIEEMPLYGEKAIRLTEYGWSFPGFKSHWEIVNQEKKLQSKKLEYDVKNAERVYKSYPSTRIMAIIACVISVCLLFLKLAEALSIWPYHKRG